MTTDQRCAVPTCGHPEANHVCEDEGINAQPYHGDDWCELCPTGPHEYKPPTPTSSLEEARYAEALRRMEMARAIAGGGEHEGWWIEGFVKGAEWERAEVIREVEAALQEAQDALTENITTWITLQPSLDKPYEDRPEWTPWTRFGERAAKAASQAHARLRALSQGGEGKA